MDDFVTASDLRMEFPIRGAVLSRVLSRQRVFVHALDGVSLAIRRGEIFGLAGESGSGKTTLGRILAGLLRPTAGEVLFEGSPISSLREKDMRVLRRRIQVIFQDPHASLNPAMTIGAAIGHPLIIHAMARDSGEARPRVLEMMEEVGLSPAAQLYGKFPSELSGGQKQRAVIARAMILNPSFIVADEPVAMLDMSVRARILELMLDLKKKHDLTYLFITHDLATAKFLCDRVAIMYLGRIVEEARAEALYRDPKHPYTQSLLKAIPVPDPRHRVPKELPQGEMPDAIAPPANCHFHPRCPSAVAGCGWEPRDLTADLEKHRSQLVGEDLQRDVELLGKEFRVKGDRYNLVLEVPTERAQRSLEYLRSIIQGTGGLIRQAIVETGTADGGLVVRFHPEVPLEEVAVDGHRVLCILYQRGQVPGQGFN